MAVSLLTGFTKKITDLPDTPSANMTTTELKEWFDSSPEELRTKLNEEITEKNTHLSQTTTQQIIVSRDLSIVGSQIVSGFTAKPKRLDIYAFVAGSSTFSNATVSQNGQIAVTRFSNDQMSGLGTGVAIGSSDSSFTRGNVTINNDNTITFNWTKVGSGATGTADIYIVAHYH